MPADLSDPIFIQNLVEKISSAVLEKFIKQGLTPPATQNPPIAPASISSDAPPLNLSREQLASKIDHTLLKPDATWDEVQQVCDEALKYRFATVCVNSAFISFVAKALKGSPTKPIAVVGFPLGAAATPSKAFEAREAIRSGAREIDMVVNIGALKGYDYALVLEDIRQVVEATKPHPVKVILETSNLNEEQKAIGCALAKVGGAMFVKTSTGFGTGGATVEDIKLMRRIVGPEMGVKASGGIRNYADAIKMLAAGANRIGASASVMIVQEAEYRLSSTTIVNS